MPPVWTDLTGAVSLVQDGDLVALGGHTRNAPMTLIRELIRQGRRDLKLITTPTGGLNVDLLIGAGAATGLHFAQVVLDEFGLAPHFRQAAQAGRLQLWEYP